MKRYYFSLILMTAIFAELITSCEKAETAVGMTISGTLEFSERYDEEITKVEVVIREPAGEGFPGSAYKKVTLASGTYFNGGFSLELPAKVDDKYLDSHFFDEEFPTTIKITDKKVKTGAFSFSTTNMDETKESQIPTTGGFVVHRGIVYPLIYAKSDDKSVTEAMFLYADRKCSIIGSMTVYDELTAFTIEKTLAYSVHLKRGWNVLYVTQTEFMEKSDKQVRRDEFSTNPVSGLKWYVHWDFY